MRKAFFISLLTLALALGIFSGAGQVFANHRPGYPQMHWLDAETFQLTGDQYKQPTIFTKITGTVSGKQAYEGNVKFKSGCNEKGFRITISNGEFEKINTDSPKPLPIDNISALQGGCASNAQVVKDFIELFESDGAGDVGWAKNEDANDYFGDDPVSAGTGDGRASCEASGFDLSWIFCPVINGLASASDGIFNGFIKPFLQTTIVDINNTEDGIYQAWSSFRIIANIILVIALLVVVFGQSIGGGIIDAYTAKKIMPRLLVSAILINISIYLVALAVDVTNILGEGVGRLMTAPFDIGDYMSIEPNFLVSAGGLAGFVAGTWAVVTFSATLLPFLWLFVLMPALLAMIGVFVTLILRQGLILFLIIVSPVAFALYCLPNTEKYFRKWWDLLFKALLVYPIIVALFALAHILAVTIASANGTSGPRATLGQIAGIIVMLIPLFLIPFAFKMAGGAVASLYGALSGWGKKGSEAIKGNANDLNSYRNRTRRNLGSEMTKRRAEYVRSNANQRGFRGLRGRALNYGHVFNKEAMINKEGADRVDMTTNFGDDLYERARASIPMYRGMNGEKTVHEEEAQRIGGVAQRWTDDKGNSMRLSLNGQKEYTDNDYKKASGLYKTMGEMQESVWYEGKKARDLGHAETFQDNYALWAEQEGLTENQAVGIATGVGFKHQPKRKEWKYTKPKLVTDANGRKRFEIVRPHQSLSKFEQSVGPNGTATIKKEGAADALISEAYSDMGSWTMSQEGDSMMEEVGRVKEAYAARMRELSSKPALSAEEQAELSNTREQYKKIDGMETTWVADPKAAATQAARMGLPIPSDEDGAPGYSGLSGAPQAVIDAARRVALRQATVRNSDGTTKTETVRKQYDDNGNLKKAANEI